MSYPLWALNPLCRSTVGDMLNLTTSNSHFRGEEERVYNEIKKYLQNELSELCKTDKDSSAILTEMYNSCFKQIREKVKTKESKARFENTCDTAYIATSYYIEGLQIGLKDNTEKFCEEYNSLSDLEKEALKLEREIPPGIPEKMSNRKK